MTQFWISMEKLLNSSYFKESNYSTNINEVYNVKITFCPYNLYYELILAISINFYDDIYSIGII